MKSFAGNTLIYGHRKQPDIKWDISSPELRAKAFLELFNYLQKEWQVYSADYWGKNKKEIGTQKSLYNLAKTGDAASAEKLLRMRVNYEYEEWRIVSSPVESKGEPKKVIAHRNTTFVKDIRRLENGHYSFILNNGEGIEFAYIPINTTKGDWKNAYIVSGFLVDSFLEKLGRDQDFIKKMSEVLSHMNYMRLTLYYTMFPERMPLGKNLALWQKNSLNKAEDFIDELGDTPVEKLSEKEVRPTDLQKAQDKVSELVLQYESFLGQVKNSDTIEELKRILPSYAEKLTKIKKTRNLV